MKSAIKDIFNGFRGQMETMQMPKEFFDYADELSEIYNELQKKLSPELFGLHEKYKEILDDHNDEEIDFYFVEGFKLGLSIGIECASN